MLRMNRCRGRINSHEDEESMEGVGQFGHVEPERENDSNVGNGMGVCWKTEDRTD